MKTPKRIDLTPADVDRLLERVEAKALEEGDFEIIKAMAETIVYLSQAVDRKGTSISRLLRMLFGASTEKTDKLLPEANEAPANSTASGGNEPPGEEMVAPKKKRGHGRKGAAEYTGANKIKVSHESLKSGHRCPECTKGKVYEQEKPGIIVRVTGQAPLQGTVFELQKFRCNLCGKTFTAPTPEGVGAEKYDESVASMIGLLKYGNGLPFHRLQNLQGTLGVPVPASTQWQIVQEAIGKITPAYDELLRQGAQGDIVYNDDTNVKILELMEVRRERAELTDEGPSARRGLFTTGIISTVGSRRIALYFSGPNHAGENLRAVLTRRRSELSPPIQMCDGLSRNLPKDLETLLANCLAHSRRKFVDVLENFPQQCRHVLEVLRDVYHNDALAKEQRLAPQKRLEFHQARSQPLMEELQQWLTEQLEQKKVEPNSGLGDAISYMLKHWQPLTLFLREPGAPLDNNLCERALKKAIRHRKNSLFYKTTNGAHVGDIYMSLIHTCELCGTNPFEYLTALQKHSVEVLENPQDWLPWNYEATMSEPG